MVIESTLRWVDINKELPIIPPDMHGIIVFVIIYDPVYDEITGKGKEIQECVYIREKNITDKKYSCKFMTKWYNGNELVFDVPAHKILYWSYVPDVNNLPLPLT